MPKPGGKSERPSVRDVVAAKAVSTVPPFSSEQHREVALCFEINDAASGRDGRCTIKDLHTLLTEHYGFRGSQSTLERMAVHHFGRVSWGRAK